MSIADILSRRAKEFAEQCRPSIPELEQNLRETEKQKLEIEAALQLARLRPERALDFQPTFGGDYQCPRCWACDGVHSTLSNLPGTSKFDLYRCPECGTEIEINF